MTSAEVQDLIVCGYIKENFDSNFPDVLAHLIVLFYDQYHRLRLNDEQLKVLFPANFMFKSNTTPIIRHFEVKEIRFRMEISQSLLSKKVDFVVVIESFISSKIKRMTFLVQLFCPQTQTRHHKVETINDHIIGRKFKWDTQSLPHSTYFKKFNTLEFCCFVDVLYIKYQDKVIDDYIKPINTKTKFNHKIVIDGNMLDSLFIHNRQKYYSETFGTSNNWFIQGRVKYNDEIGGCLHLKLRLLYIPNSPRYVKYRYSLQCNGVKSEQVGHGWNVTDFVFDTTNFKYTLKPKNESLSIGITLNSLESTY